jgi:hypothetical protein
MAHEAAGIPARPAAADTRVWRVDTKALVGAVLLGIVMVLVNQVTARLDTALTGGTISAFSGSTWAIISAVSVRLFRQPAGVITGLIQAFVAIATATNPLAPAFLFANSLGPLAYSVVLRARPDSGWGSHFLTQLAQNVVGNAATGVGVVVLLRVPLEFAVPAVLITAAIGIVASTLITKPITDAVERSGVAE